MTTQNTFVFMGKHVGNITEPWEQKLPVVKIIIHPEYDNILVPLHDYCLLRLGRSINLNIPQAGLVCLPYNHLRVKLGMYMRVSGWGRINSLDNYTLSHVLKSSDLVTISRNKCQSFYDARLLMSNFCCRGIDKNSSPCQGDSGGEFQYFFLSIFAPWTGLTILADFENPTTEATYAHRGVRFWG